MPNPGGYGRRRAACGRVNAEPGPACGQPFAISDGTGDPVVGGRAARGSDETTDDRRSSHHRGPEDVRSGGHPTAPGEVLRPATVARHPAAGGLDGRRLPAAVARGRHRHGVARHPRPGPGHPADRPRAGRRQPRRGRRGLRPPGGCARGPAALADHDGRPAAARGPRRGAARRHQTGDRARRPVARTGGAAGGGHRRRVVDAETRLGRVRRRSAVARAAGGRRHVRGGGRDRDRRRDRSRPRGAVRGRAAVVVATRTGVVDLVSVPATSTDLVS